MWDLPQLVRPLDVRYTHPNANMLGWAPAANLFQVYFKAFSMLFCAEY